MTQQKQTILLVDDDEGIREQLKWSLKKDYHVIQADNAQTGIDLVKSHKPNLLLLDLALSEDSDPEEGLDVFEKVQLLHPKTKVIILTGNEERDTALKAVQMGAYDYYRKPIDLDELQIILKRALHLQKLETEVNTVSLQREEESQTFEIIGECSQMMEVFDIIQRTSGTDATILINGESGTGKELVAKAIHLQSQRRNHPFVVINCGAIPENLLESELFGHEKGAFTGAHVQRKGKFELANKGTVFLDEIGELSVTLQVKILRFLQEREIERVGGRQPIELDVRVIAATNRNLGDEIESGHFRADLFYRLSVITINLPPLRERGEDLNTLTDFFFRQFVKEYDKKIRGVSSAAYEVIRQYQWPGNIRELENKIKRAVIMSKSSLIQPGDLNLKIQDTARRRSLKESVEEFEERCIVEALERNAGNVSKTARELGVNRTTFYDMLHKYDIDHTQYTRKKNENNSVIS